MDSYDAYVNLTGSLGLYMLHHLDHLHPDPKRRLTPDVFDDDWIGYPRLKGSRGERLEDWPEPQRSRYADVATCPEEWLLFFHRLPHGHCLRDGRGVLEALVENVESGYQTFRRMPERWSCLEDKLDVRLGEDMRRAMEEQNRLAVLWGRELTRFFQETPAKVEIQYNELTSSSLHE